MLRARASHSSSASAPPAAAQPLRKFKLITLISLFMAVVVVSYRFAGRPSYSSVASDTSPTANAVTGRRAFITFVASDSGDEGYLHAAAVLCHTLKENANKKRRQKIPVIAMVIENRLKKQTEEWLIEKAKFDRIIPVPPIPAPHKTGKANWQDTYTKLNLWKLTEFEKIVFIDSDTVVLQNIDDLFDHPQLSAALECCGFFNSGVMVIEPSVATFVNMTAHLTVLPSYDNADGGFLNSYFASFHELPFYFNALQSFYLHTPTAFDYHWDRIRVIHYIGAKPWTSNDNNNNNNADNKLHELWQSLYNEIKPQL